MIYLYKYLSEVHVSRNGVTLGYKNQLCSGCSSLVDSILGMQVGWVSMIFFPTYLSSSLSFLLKFMLPRRKY